MLKFSFQGAILALPGVRGRETPGQRGGPQMEGRGGVTFRDFPWPRQWAHRWLVLQVLFKLHGFMHFLYVLFCKIKKKIKKCRSEEPTPSPVS